MLSVFHDVHYFLDFHPLQTSSVKDDCEVFENEFLIVTRTLYVFYAVYKNEIMMFEHADGAPILHLTEDQSWQLLDNTKHGRIALYAGVEVDIFPVNYASRDRVLYLRTAPGSKLAELAVNPKVAFEADGILSDQAWSVVVHGEAKILETEADIAAARDSGVSPWVPTTKEMWVRITPTAVTGRHFIFGDQPEMDDQI